jgi:hypothetical protein
VSLLAFVATAADVPRLLPSGPGEGVAHEQLSGVDPANLASLVELVTRGELTANGIQPDLERQVAEAGPGGPWVYGIPAEATSALAGAEPADLDRWAQDWGGSPEAAHDDVGLAVQALGRLAAQASPQQSLYVWLSRG